MRSAAKNGRPRLLLVKLPDGRCDLSHPHSNPLSLRGLRICSRQQGWGPRTGTCATSPNSAGPPGCAHFREVGPLPQLLKGAFCSPETVLPRQPAVGGARARGWGAHGDVHGCARRASLACREPWALPCVALLCQACFPLLRTGPSPPCWTWNLPETLPLTLSVPSSARPLTWTLDHAAWAFLPNRAPLPPPGSGTRTCQGRAAPSTSCSSAPCDMVHCQCSLEPGPQPPGTPSCSFPLPEPLRPQLTPSAPISRVRESWAPMSQTS